MEKVICMNIMENFLFKISLLFLQFCSDLHGIYLILWGEMFLSDKKKLSHKKISVNYFDELTENERK